MSGFWDWLFGRPAAAMPANPVPAASPARSEPASPGPPAATAPPIPVAAVGDAPRTRLAVCLDFVLKHEAGYVDHPKDPGGATNRGITKATLAEWRGRPVTKAEVRELPEKEARAIYAARYWNPVRGDKLGAPLDLAVLDGAVNSGPGQAAKWLQRCLAVEVDGFIGPATLAAVASHPDRRALALMVIAQREAFLKRLDTWGDFGKGWTARLDGLRKEVGAV